jgi:eukaryotic-like serine/threonine-protein kinase
MSTHEDGKNGKRNGDGRPDGPSSYEDSVVAYDEALGSEHTASDQESADSSLDQNARKRFEQTKECLQLIERVREHRQKTTLSLPVPHSFLSPHNAYTAAGELHRIGRFEIVRELGRGSHGIVFLARDPGLNREIALKVPRPEAILTPQLRSRFLREGKAAARLNHPNIVPVHEAGEAGPICYLVQSYCSGPSLASWLASETNPVPCDVAARLVAELADGVDHAHQQGILHRDIKPANVMLEIGAVRAEGRGQREKTDGPSSDFTPRLTDFGLAKALDDDPNATATLGAVGTATYMPPEQAEGKLSLVGPRSDVYSLGALLYEILTRRPPIAGANQLETLRLIPTKEPDPLREVRADVPRDLEAVCLKCLEKSPAQRYATAKELADDLRRFLNGDAVTASPYGGVRHIVRRLRRRPVWQLAGGIAALLLITGAMVGFWVSSSHRGIESAEEYLAGIERASQAYYDAVANRGDVKTAVQELDTFLERNRPQQGRADHRGFEWNYLWRLCHPDKAAVPFPKLFDLVGHKGDVYFVTFSPDDTLLATAGQDHIGRIWDARTGKLHATLAGHTDDVNWISFYPAAGTRRVLTASDDKTVRIWNCDSGKLESTLTHTAPVVAVEVARAFNHEQADQILTGDDRGQLRIWDWESRQFVRMIPAHSQRIQALTPSRARSWWWTASSDGTAKEWQSLNWVQVATHVADSADPHGRSASIFSVSCNTQATLAAFAWGWPHFSGRAGVAPSRDAAGIMQAGYVTIDDLLTHTRWLQLAGPATLCYECVRFYPGRCALVATCRDNPDNGGGEHDVVYVDIPTQKFWKPIVETHPSSWCAAFSNDGTRLATTGNDGTVRVWDSSMIPTGTRLDRLEGGMDKPPSAARFSPDGRKLLVTYGSAEGPSRGHPFVVWDVSGGRPKPMYSEPTQGSLDGSSSGCFSPDGRLIAIDATEWSGQKFQSHIRVLDSESMREIRRIAGDKNSAHRILMSPNGTDIAAVTGDRFGMHMRLNLWNINSSAPVIVRPESSSARDYLDTTLAPDGKLLAMSRSRVEIYDFPSLRLNSTLPFGLGEFGALRFSPDGQILAAGGNGGMIHLWDVRRGVELATLRSDGHAVLALAFSPDGTRLAVGLDGAARVDVWHLPTRRRLTPFAMPSDLASVTDLDFSPDQRTLAAVGMGGTGGVFLFPLEPVDERIR